MGDNRLKISYALELSAKLIDKYDIEDYKRKKGLCKDIAEQAITIVDTIFDKYKEDERV